MRDVSYHLELSTGKQCFTQLKRVYFVANTEASLGNNQFLLSSAGLRPVHTICQSKVYDVY